MQTSHHVILLSGLLLLIVSLVASMLFGTMVPKDDDYITDRERVRHDIAAMRPYYPYDWKSEPGQMALFPDGTLAVHLLNRENGDGAYLLGDGRILHMGPVASAEQLRGPFTTDRLT